MKVKIMFVLSMSCLIVTMMMSTMATPARSDHVETSWSRSERRQIISLLQEIADNTSDN